jgi:hypothetical protein
VGYARGSSGISDTRRFDANTATYDPLAARIGARHDGPLLNSGTLACFVALATLPIAGAAVDTSARNRTFEPKPTRQERVEKERTEIGESQPATDTEVGFVTVPAAKAKLRTPAVREKKPAPIDMASRSFPSHQPVPARISTDRAAPAKFDRKVATPTVTRIQDGMTEAGRVRTTTTKARAKASVFGRINRFVFRRNEAAPATKPTGGENKSVDGAAAPVESTSS